jgi:hypothetical protein
MRDPCFLLRLTLRGDRGSLAHFAPSCDTLPIIGIGAPHHAELPTSRYLAIRKDENIVGCPHLS